MRKKMKNNSSLLVAGTKRALEVATMGGYASSRVLDSETSRYMTICREVKRYVKKHEKETK